MHKFNRNDRVKIMRGKYKDKIAVVSQVVDTIILSRELMILSVY